MDIFTSLHLPDFADANVWISLLTLTFLEIVLGIDNIIFISILSGKLPYNQQRKTRNIGLFMAMIFRIMLLLMISWIISLKEPVISLKWFDDPLNPGKSLALSWKDIILISGGIFLIIKSTLEIHHKTQFPTSAQSSAEKPKKGSSFLLGAVIQIVLIDAVFSIDSILTAIGLVENVVIMIVAVVISITIMMLFAGAVSKVINKHPSLQMLALSFLVVIGVVLVAEGIHQHISKNIIYSCLAFSLAVELLNIRVRNKQEKGEKTDIHNEKNSQQQ